MLDIVKEAIDNFYIRKNYQSFKEKCNLSLRLPEELIPYIILGGIDCREHKK